VSHPDRSVSIRAAAAVVCHAAGHPVRFRHCKVHKAASGNVSVRWTCDSFTCDVSTYKTTAELWTCLDVSGHVWTCRDVSGRVTIDVKGLLLQESVTPTRVQQRWTCGVLSVTVINWVTICICRKILST
jgi:hypothetical protein